jgi:uncharacterized protein (DUF885 family)
MRQNPIMTESGQSASSARPVRTVADDYVDQLTQLNSLVATTLGRPVGQDRLPDLSPAGEQAAEDLRIATLARLTDTERGNGGTGGQADEDSDERRCARLLRERLETERATFAAGEHLRAMSNIFGPPQQMRGTFPLMPAATPDDWATIARRVAAVPGALAGHRESLSEGARLGLYAAPRQVETVAGQLADWQPGAAAKGWFGEFTGAADVPDALRADLDTAAASADAAVATLCGWLRSDYLPGTEGTPDGVGPERYALGVRRWLGARLDLTEAYEWGWSQYREIMAQMTAEAASILPGASPREAMRYLDEHSPVIEGVEEVRVWLQDLMNQAMTELDGTQFELADPVKVAEAPYYTAPAQDFSRPGRTWLPTLGKTSFPLWGLYSTWYHEGVPGHHMQLAQWAYRSDRLSAYQTLVGGVSACLEGWALYAERLMDELGYLEPPGAQMGYLDAQLMRAIRVIIDIGMHLSLTVAADSPMFAGETWTPDLALDFFDAHIGRGRDFLASEVVRYLGLPGQAISYKIGERAWLAGREAARLAHADSFDQRSWHMSALSLGSLGLDDLADELARL